jgi:hypothetical protein
MRRSVALLAVVALAACGGSGGERLSRDTYVARADAICADVAAQREVLPAPTSIAEIPGYVDKALPIIDAALVKLRALRPPLEMQQSVTAWLDTTAQTLAVLADLRRAAQDGNPAGDKVRAFAAKAKTLNDRRGALARSIGLTSCAST